MTKDDIKYIVEVFSVIIGQPMRNVERAGSTIYLDFGELIEIDTFEVAKNGRLARDKDGKLIPTRSMVGEHRMEIICAVRFICGDEVIFAGSDIFLPTDEQLNKPDFVWATFNWHTIGNTAFDEIIARHFRGRFDDYIVKGVKVNKFGDLTLTFKNGFILELFVNNSEKGDGWGFNKITSTRSSSLIITGRGVYRE